MRWSAGTDRASSVPVNISGADGSETVMVDETRNGGKWVLLGTREFDAVTACDVLVRTNGTNATVIADAFRF